ncbi:MAG: hypothetical protein Q8P50_17955 [Bacillota bacterium]|nr:hypothetical protein [Bacillota bacterium]
MTPRFSIRPWGYTRRAVDGFIERLYASTKMFVVDACTETSRLEAANLKLDQELAEIERETTGLQEREAKVARAIADSRSRASQMLANARDDLDRRRDEAMAAERGFRSLTFVLESLLQQAAGVSDRPGTVPDRTARRQ